MIRKKVWIVWTFAARASPSDGDRHESGRLETAWALIPIRAIYHDAGDSHSRGVMDTWLIAWFHSVLTWVCQYERK